MFVNPVLEVELVGGPAEGYWYALDANEDGKIRWPFSSFISGDDIARDTLVYTPDTNSMQAAMAALRGRRRYLYEPRLGQIPWQGEFFSPDEPLPPGVK